MEAGEDFGGCCFAEMAERLESGSADEWICIAGESEKRIDRVECCVAGCAKDFSQGQCCFGTDAWCLIASNFEKGAHGRFGRRKKFTKKASRTNAN